MTYTYRKATQEDQDKYHFLEDMYKFGDIFVEKYNYNLEKLHTKICVDSEGGGLLVCFSWGTDESCGRRDISFLYKKDGIAYLIELNCDYSENISSKKKIAIFTETKIGKVIDSLTEEVQRDFYDALIAYQSRLVDKGVEGTDVVLKNSEGKRIL